MRGGSVRLACAARMLARLSGKAGSGARAHRRIEDRLEAWLVERAAGFGPGVARCREDAPDPGSGPKAASQEIAARERKGRQGVQATLKRREAGGGARLERQRQTDRRRAE